MDCPRCGTPTDGPECPGCGVLVAKARPTRERAPLTTRHPPAWHALVVPALALAALVVAAVWHLRAQPVPPGQPSGQARPGGSRELPKPPAPSPDAAGSGLPAPVPGLVDPVTFPPPVPPSPAARPEDPLAGRHAALRRAFDAGDWAAVEILARELTAATPGDPGALRVLAYALLRQDRAPEAEELLASFLETQQDVECRQLLDRIRQSRAADSGLDARRLSHFRVRYDGEAHEDVGREVLRVLERHYATLARTFDHQPAEPVPVTLLARESYYDATGAPAWSGGQYDSFDGHVRIPIGGLTASRTPELDRTVLHELTHAFVADRSRGRAPRELHEGLAQLMEGKRAEELLGGEGLRALAEGRLDGVRGFYASSLAFVEDLLAQRGQGGINEVLGAMATTDPDEAFRRVYGRDLAGLQAAWAARLRQRHAR